MSHRCLAAIGVLVPFQLFASKQGLHRRTDLHVRTSANLLQPVGTALATVIAVLSLAGGQAACQAPTADTWTPSRTPWGNPDLQGIWSPGYYLTPLERPEKFAGREFLTDEEVAALEKEAEAEPGRDFRPQAGSEADVEGAYNDAFTGRGKEVIRTKRTSLIVDPPDGKIPPLTAEEQARRAAASQALAAGRRDFRHYAIDVGRPADNPEDRNPLERCRGITLPFIRGTSGTYSRIAQTPGYVTLYYEDGHNGGAYRTVPLDGRPHLPAHVRQWLGDSRGWWEGDTLVVDTTNFTDRTNFNGSGQNLHLVERFTRVEPDMIEYEVTVEDPTVWTRPWTVELPLTKMSDKENQIFEAACHEGNYALTSILAGARALEREAERIEVGRLGSEIRGQGSGVGFSRC